MSNKKGLCPVSFLWSGQGLGVYIKRASLILALMIFMLNVIWTLFCNGPLLSAAYILAAFGLWLTGTYLTWHS